LIAQHHAFDDTVRVERIESLKGESPSGASVLPSTAPLADDGDGVDVRLRRRCIVIESEDDVPRVRLDRPPANRARKGIADGTHEAFPMQAPSVQRSTWRAVVSSAVAPRFG
jgi:hypothetical protein